jgi:SNF2 family DNA or RNA helicase
VNNYLPSTSIYEKDAWDDFILHSADYYSILESYTGVKTNVIKTEGDMPQDLVERIESQELNCSLLKSSLRGYQVFGAKYAIVQRRTLIGDEMGLGKTVEAIAAITHLYFENAKYFYVVCPASVLINWCREIEKHSHLKAYKVHGVSREASMQEWIRNGGVAVTTYETTKSISPPPKLKIDLLVADEAHYVKNPLAQRSQAISKLAKRSERVIFMTGTPLENRVEEMKNLIGILQPNVAIEIDSKELQTAPQKFRRQIAPVYLRRNREDVLKELPELIQIEEWVDFGIVEKTRYIEAVQEGRFMYMRRVAWSVGNAETSPKLKRLLEICDEARENNHKIIIFSFFRDVIATVSNALGERCMEPITGSVSPNRRQQIIDEFTEAPRGAVIVSQVQAGGVGLNIQAASVVIFCEPQIKPALETQAISRAYRMGQVKKVVVHRLLTEDSVDERMMEMLGSKQQLFDSYARDSVITESSLQATDITEKKLIDQIVEKEQIRLGLTKRPPLNLDDSTDDDLIAMI